MSIDGDLFKECMSRWASGVTIVTTRSGEVVHGMTVSDFGGVSLSPPLVSVCCNRESRTTELIAEGKCFAVNVLAADQSDLSNLFASSSRESERFDGLECPTAATGAPLIPGAVVQLDCRLVASHEAGDHLLYIGRIEQAFSFPREPLIYFAGRYCRLAPS